MADEQFNCDQCGADLVFEPGASALTCQYCGHTQPVAQPEGEIREIDFHTALAAAGKAETNIERQEVSCSGCGAAVTLSAEVASDQCPYCGSGIDGVAHTTRLIQPKSLLPFKISGNEARDSFHHWLSTRWFAPSALKSYKGRENTLQGVYVPYWTYDCQAHTRYSGERGDDYWTTETYTTTENGKSVRKTRRVRKTRWRHVSGAVRNAFDDVLVLATSSLPHKLAEKLEPWDLQELMPYDDDFLQGFRAESYRIGLEQGFGIATNRMRPIVRSTVRRDIGGDHQRIHHCDTDYRDITFKHLLLPVWISSFRYKDTAFRFLVNARTGEVQGERPYSWVKISLAVAALLLVVAVAVWIYATRIAGG